MEQINMFNYIPERINEETARRAKEMSSFSDYKPGTATAEYTGQMESLLEIAEEYARKSRFVNDEPERITEAQSYINYYSRKFAEYINKDNEISCRCPSVMIAGPANFPTRKKEKQVAAWDANRKNYISLDDARYKLHYILLEDHPISGSDPEAIEKLTKKLERLEANYAAVKEEFQKAQKEFNAELKAGIITKTQHYYGCRIPEGFTEADRNNPEMIKCLSDWEKRAMVGTVYIKDGQTVDKPALGYRSSNMSQERTRILKRIEELKRLQEAPATEESGEGWNLYEDNEAGRICFEFDGKPEQEIINELKHNGFKWSPRNMRWQRQNTDNGRRAAEVVKKLLTA
jgi:hypothetical protein